MELAPIESGPANARFYVRTLAVLNEAGMPFFGGGATRWQSTRESNVTQKTWTFSYTGATADAVLKALDGGRLSYRGLVPALAGQGLQRGRLH